jgi:phosphoribosyl-ATP pyrophosphohydrolase
MLDLFCLYLIQLLYHLVVLMLRRGLTPEDIYKNL